MQHALTHALVTALALATATMALAGSIEAGDQLEMAAVLKAPITPTKAVQIAERGGGRAFTYGMEAIPSGHWYEISVLRGSDKLLLKIDAESGKLISSSPARGDDAHGAHALDASRLAFGEAIAIAERVGDGPALEAGAAGQGDLAHVDVDVIQNHGKRIAHYRVHMSGGKPVATLTGSDS